MTEDPAFPKIARAFISVTGSWRIHWERESSGETIPEDSREQRLVRNDTGNADRANAWHNLVNRIGMPPPDIFRGN
jgi:hypothetical protein